MWAKCRSEREGQRPPLDRREVGEERLGSVQERFEARAQRAFDEIRERRRADHLPKLTRR